MRRHQNGEAMLPILFLLAVGLLAAGAYAVVGQSAGNKCSGKIVTLLGRLTLECSGPACCDQVLGNDMVGDFDFCACDPTQQPECCYTVLRLDELGRPSYGDSRGDCFAANERCKAGACSFSTVEGSGKCE